MQENNIRLIDEALLDEPIKNTFRLAWEFIGLNRNFTFIVIGVFIVLHLLGTIPVLSLIFSILAGIFGVAIQMFMGKIFYSTENIETYIEEIKESRLELLLKKHFKTASGVYLGLILLLFLMMMLFVMIAMFTGVVDSNMNEGDILIALIGLSVPFMLLLLIFSYVQPLVLSNIILANSFEEGFKAVFTLFSKDVWSSAMRKEYFTYVAKAGLVLMVMLLVIGFIVNILIMLPIINFFTTIFMLIFMYISMVFISIMSMMARRIVEE